MIFQPLFRIIPPLGTVKEISSSSNLRFMSKYSLACNFREHKDSLTIYIERGKNMENVLVLPYKMYPLTVRSASRFLVITKYTLQSFTPLLV